MIYTALEVDWWLLFTANSLFVDISERDPFSADKHEQHHLFGLELAELLDLMYCSFHFLFSSIYR
jgi:hypothetical protein